MGRAVGWVMQSGSDSALSQLRVQEFLDEVCNLESCEKHISWYNVDVATMLEGCKIRGHSTNPEDGSAVIFLNESVVVCDPKEASMQHYPRGMVHCFVDDKRNNPEQEDGGPIFSTELFSISPRGEELCYILSCEEEHEVPIIQNEVANWLSWLN
ncbi:hypothetical protein OAV27_02530 [Euryarchaeota archaeon]|nr:hypothetical protein [Euryarchaeota archaeon]